MKKFAMIVIGLVMALGLATTTSAAEVDVTMSQKTNDVTHYADAQVAYVRWSAKFHNKKSVPVKMKYQFRVGYESTVANPTYRSIIYVTVVPPNYVLEVENLEIIPYSAIQNQWWSRMKWRWVRDFRPVGVLQ